jgi:hypothetical protein
MSKGNIRIRSAVRRYNSEHYLLISLVAFGVTVIAIRVFLELTGYPQIGNSVLHIAHALWGGLLLIIAVMLPLAFANRWAIQASALISGIGIGLFIDEVGKFITQTNDYFFPPAMALIYGFFLLTVLVYLYFRRPRQEDPRSAMYHALEGLQDALDGDLDTEEAASIEAQLSVARQSEQEELVSLANAIGAYLRKEKRHLAAAEPDFWKRIAMRVDRSASRLGRRRHRTIISLVLILWTLFVIAFIAVLVLWAPTLESQIVQWRGPLIAIQALVGVSMIVAAASWLSGEERRGLKFAVSGFLLSLIAVQSLYFYLSQFQAITVTLLQFTFLLILLAYRRRYLSENVQDTLLGTVE